MRHARRADAAVLTDSTAVRGRLFGGVLRAWAAQGRLSADEERWVRSVVHIEWESPRALPRMSAAHVRVTTFRRLVNDRPVRVRVHDRVYEVLAASRGRARFQPVVLRDGERSDGQVRIADVVRWSNNMSNRPSEDVPFRGVVFEGDAIADIWWPVARFEHTVPVGIGTDPAVERVQDDPQIAAWLDGLRGMLRWERDPGSMRAWPVGVEIVFPEDEDAGWPAGFTFGGGVFLEVLWSGRTEYEVLASAGASWWALRDRQDRRGRRVIEGRGEWMAFDGGPPRWGERLMAWPGDGERLEDARLVIRHLDAGMGRMFGPYWDLEAERVWQRYVRITLADDERERLERWMTEKRD